MSFRAVLLVEEIDYAGNEKSRLYELDSFMIGERRTSIVVPLPDRRRLSSVMGPQDAPDFPPNVETLMFESRIPLDEQLSGVLYFVHTLRGSRSERFAMLARLSLVKDRRSRSRFDHSSRISDPRPKTRER